MRFHHQLRYDAPPAAVRAMLADPDFREKVCQAQDAAVTEVRVEPDGESMHVVVDQSRPSDDIPGFARKLVGDEIRIVQDERWSDATSADLHVTIPGKPGELRGSVTLAPDGSGTVETIQGELKVDVPLIGAKLESLIAELLTVACDAEHEVGRTWLGEG